MIVVKSRLCSRPLGARQTYSLGANKRRKLVKSPVTSGRGDESLYPPRTVGI
jgi:hypothetical protein